MSYRSVARITKTHGRKGEVVAVPAHGLPPCLETGQTVWPVPPALKGPRSRRVEQAYETDHGQVVSLSGIETIDAAKRLVGRTLLVDVAELPADLALRDVSALLGRGVTDVAWGHLGEVTEVLRNPAQDVLVVTGPAGEVMIPVVEAFVRDIRGTEDIVVEVPETLLGLGHGQRREEGTRL